MRTLRGSVGIIVATVIGLGLSVRPAQAVTYSFIDLGDSTSLGGTLNDLGSPALNINGQVSFFARTNTSTRRIILASGSGSTVIVGNGSISNGQTLTSVIGPSLNNAGSISFWGFRSNSTDAIYVTSSTGGTPVELAVATFGTGQFGAFDNRTFINSGGAGGGTLTGGRVVFMAQDPNATKLGLYKASNGSAPQTIVDSTPTFGTFNNFNSWMITPTGTTTFNATKNGTAGVYTATTGLGSVGTIAIGSYNGAVMNDAAKVSFNTNSTIFTRTQGDSGSVAFVGIGSSGFAGFNLLGSPQINNVGSIVFLAQNTSTSAASLFAGANATNDRIVGTGSSLFGSTVTGISGYSMNDNGQIAFNVSLANGVQAIALATPIVSPVTTFSQSISPTQNLQRDLEFGVTTNSGKAQVIGDPLSPSNGVIDFADYEGGFVKASKKFAAQSNTLHAELDYRFITAGSFDVMVNNVTLQTISASASSVYTHLSNDYNLSSFGVGLGDQDFVLRLNSAAGTREFLVDNLSFNAVPEPKTLATLLVGTLLLFVRPAFRGSRAIMPCDGGLRS